MATDHFRILSLDGGGAKGFYSLGVLHEIEAMIGCRLYERFDLIFGTSTGSIIAALVSLGYSVSEIHDLYRKHVVSVVAQKEAAEKSMALAKLAAAIFGDAMFDQVKTNIGIVATNWLTEKPMIFKSNIAQAHGRQGSWVPGHGVPIAEAVEASCSAFPFFNRKTVKTSAGESVELIDGGYCANNPTLYAIADATGPLAAGRERMRVVSIGVGSYPEPQLNFLQKGWWVKKLLSVQLLQKTIEINTQSMDQLRRVLFNDIETVRISDGFTTPEMATDLFEHDLRKLDILFQRGRESFAVREQQLRSFLVA